MSLIRGVLLAGKFQSQHQLNTMSPDDMRNTLIFEIARRSRQTNLQLFDNDTLAGMGAVLVFLLTARIRDDAALKGMTSDDMRNTLIVELGGQTGMSGPELQAMSNIELVKLGLGNPLPGGLTAGSFVRGVLLAGQFSTQHELDKMSSDDMRNTLIFEMTAHSNQADYQAFNDFDLAGMGAVMVFLREARLRTDAELKTMSADDQRNVAIVEIGSQTKLGSKLQGLRNMDLVRIALGVDPESIFKELPHGPPLQQPFRPFLFSVDSIEIHTQKADGDHSDSDWLTIIVAVGDAATKDQTLLSKTIHIGEVIKSGNVLTGPFKTDFFDAKDNDVVVVSYLITNLGSSDIEEQGAQAVKITNKVVSIAGPAIGAAIGLFSGAPGEGFKIGLQVAEAFGKGIAVLSDVFDFLGLHFGPANCNGEVLRDTLTFLPGELVQAAGRPASRQYTGPQSNERCGSPPESKVNFMVRQLGFDGLVSPDF
jgi:hypothetical protein